MKYENKKNGLIFETDGIVDEKTKTIFIRNVETGKEQNITISTLKRWYKLIDAGITEPEETEAETAPAETIPAEEPEKEEKKERKPRQKKETAPDVLTLHNYILDTCEKLGGVVFVPAKEMKFRGLKVGKHMFVKYHWTNNSVILQVRAEALGLEKPVTPCNHTFNDKYMFSIDTPETRAEIFRIMKTCYDWQLCRNLAREEKKETKEN